MSLAKRISCIIVVLTIALSSMLVAYADTGLVIPNEGLNLRQGPSTDYNILTVLTKGALVQIISCENNWYQVSYNGTVGYVSGDFLQVYAGDVLGFGCITDAEGNVFNEAAPSENVLTIGAKISETAALYLGTPYVYGGMGPGGFDCSGFVGFIYGLYGYGLPRSSYDMANVGVPVDRNNLLPGDILLFNTYGYGVSHVGIYVGNNMLIHSPKPGDVVRYEDINSTYYSTRYLGARRVIY